MKNNNKIRLLCFLFCVTVLSFAFPLQTARADLIWPIPDFTPDPEIYIEPKAFGPDYLVLVNELNPMPGSWGSEVEIIHTTNSQGNDVGVEAKAFQAYLLLKAALAEEDVFVDLDSAYRSVAEQQHIIAELTEQYGEDSVSRYLAAPGYSEHHTGLALDLYLIIDGENVYQKEEFVKYPEIWAKIHEKLADFGFILRFPEGREDITGHSYEPWHIRFIDSAEIAEEIMAQELTLEEYLSGNQG